MPFNPTALVLHGAAAGIMAWGYIELRGLPSVEWIHAQKGGFFQYLTIQGLIVAWLTMAFSLAADILPSVTIIKSVKRSLLMIAMPLAVVIISSIYWPLILFMPALITQAGNAADDQVPASVDALRLPLTVDLALHAAPGILLFLDFFLFEKRYSKKQASYGAPAISILSTIWYVSCAEYFASINGSFPYPFLNTVVEIRAAIYFGATILALVSFWTLNAIHR